MPSNVATSDVRAAVRKYWGFDTFRPLQEQAIAAALERRDSVVVIPTGGGKSLCYQAPAALSNDGLTLVVSPLIALMKDQVDALNAKGICSALYNSSLSAPQRREVCQNLEKKRYRLLYIAPERFPDHDFLEMLRGAGVDSIAIDEAHCISHWGHDFRPDYRKLSDLKRSFPGVSLHAFTATATPQVREDIAEQLNLVDPVHLVGDFDRPNLVYRVQWRSGLKQQVCDIIDQYRAGAGIIYCIRRKDVDELCEYLAGKGYRALPYHAGLSGEDRRTNQEAFGQGRADIIVATVAFGMGIDRSDIRYVLHTGMPKSVEAYQQETGRAGRDGLPAECTLFYTTGDFMVWKSIVERNDSQHLDVHISQLRRMLDFCTSPSCRHRLLVEHFGQEYTGTSCGACDTCLDEREVVSDSTTIAMKILSAVRKTGERFGAKYVAEVLIGADTENVRNRGHQELSVYGLMSEHSEREIRAWLEQLASAGFLDIGEEYRTFSITVAGNELLCAEREVKLFAQPRKAPTARAPRRRASRPTATSTTFEGPVDDRLYEALRIMRKKLADGNGFPAYRVFPNKTLESLARLKPVDEAQLLEVPGIGPAKLAEYGDDLLECVRRHTGT